MTLTAFLLSCKLLDDCPIGLDSVQLLQMIFEANSMLLPDTIDPECMSSVPECATSLLTRRLLCAVSFPSAREQDAS